MAEDFDENGTMEQPAPSKKRSLFSKAVTAKVSEADEAVEFFSRAKELFPQRLAEEERKRQKKLAKLERKRSSASLEANDQSVLDGKKRRTSSHAVSHDGYSSEGSVNEARNEVRESTRRGPTQSPPYSNSNLQRTQDSPSWRPEVSKRDLQPKIGTTSKAVAPLHDYISLSDGEIENDKTTLAVQKPYGQPIILDDDDDNAVGESRNISNPIVEDELQLSDEEFPELVQQARERERQKLQHRLNPVKVIEQPSNTTSGSGRPYQMPDDIFDAESTAVSNEDPIIEILITSRMEGTKPLMVKRKLSQRLKEVRFSWCDKQTLQGDLGSSLKDSIFLSWRGKRLFDATTCRALGFTVDQQGKLRSDGQSLDTEGRVHLEAWTDEGFKIYEKRQAAKLLKDRDGSEGREFDGDQNERSVPKTKLIMKSRDMDDFKLIVKPSTTIEKMINAFRNSRDIPDGKRIALYFDGEELQPASKVEEMEFTDMDTIEVHIR